MKKLFLFFVLLVVACSCSTTFHARLQDEKHFHAEGLTSVELESSDKKLLDNLLTINTYVL